MINHSTTLNHRSKNFGSQGALLKGNGWLMCLKKALPFPTYSQCPTQLISTCSHTNFHLNPCKDARSIFYPLFLFKSWSQRWLYFRSQCTWGGVVYLYVDVEIRLPCWIKRASWGECCHNWCFVPRVGGTGNEQK